ncbi:MAG: glycosyltransferase, partial [Candidatus Promineifilaceae bacterium]
DVLIEAFNQMGRPLLIAGSGRDRGRLEALAGPSITFLGRVSDADLPGLLARCRAFVWPAEEDFGIAPLQAMASGRPVIALAAGGALETVVPGTGCLFAEQSAPAIIRAVEEFDANGVSPGFIRAHAEQFDLQLFKQRLLSFIDQKVAEHSGR